MCIILSKNWKGFNIDDYKDERTWTNEFFFKTNLSTFGSNMFLTLKIMDSENAALTKVVHIYVMESMNT
jgi:hypothetical protein